MVVYLYLTGDSTASISINYNHPDVRQAIEDANENPDMSAEEMMKNLNRLIVHGPTLMQLPGTSHEYINSAHIVRVRVVE